MYAIYAYSIDPPGTTPGLIGSPMAVPWSIWAIVNPLNWDLPPVCFASPEADLVGWNAAIGACEKASVWGAALAILHRTGGVASHWGSPGGGWKE